MRERRARRGRARTTFTADQVVLAAGTWGTQSLLHRLRDTGALPRVSARLGDLTRTNSEALLGAMSRTAPERGGPRDFTRGVAITSSWHPTTTPTSSRAATATAATRWACRPR